MVDVLRSRSQRDDDVVVDTVIDLIDLIGIGLIRFEGVYLIILIFSLSFSRMQQSYAINIYAYHIFFFPILFHNTALHLFHSAIFHTVFQPCLTCSERSVFLTFFFNVLMYYFISTHNPPSTFCPF